MANDLQLTTPAYKITRTGLDIQRATTLDEWRRYGDALKAVDEAKQWAIGDWLVDGKSHYGDGLYEEASKLLGIDSGQLRHYKSLSERFELCLRKHNLLWSHHKEVVQIKKLEEVGGKLLEGDYDIEKQQELLARAEKENFTVRELRDEVGKYKRDQQRAIALHNEPKKYDLVYADPPWEYNNSGFDQSAASIYATMPTDEICKLPIKARVRDSSVLYLWATSPLLDQAFKVISSWGFEYKASMVWVKDRAPGMGWWVNTKHELLLIATRGENLHPAVKHDSVFHGGVTEHSKKPSSVYGMIEEAHPSLDKIELFARNERDGWDSWGNEVET